MGQGYGWVEIAGLSFHRLQVVDDGVADVALETAHRPRVSSLHPPQSGVCHPKQEERHL